MPKPGMHTGNETDSELISIKMAGVVSDLKAIEFGGLSESDFKYIDRDVSNPL